MKAAFERHVMHAMLFLAVMTAGCDEYESRGGYGPAMPEAAGPGMPAAPAGGGEEQASPVDPAKNAGQRHTRPPPAPPEPGLGVTETPAGPSAAAGEEGTGEPAVTPGPPTNASTIKYSGLREIEVVMTPGDEDRIYEIDVDGNGAPDYRVVARYGDIMFAPLAGNKVAAEAGHVMSPLERGFPISGDLPSPFEWATGTQSMVSLRVESWDPVPATGPWVVTTNGYAGFAFGVDGATNYGWARMTVVGLVSVTLHDWAYETRPGVAIEAGREE